MDVTVWMWLVWAGLSAVVFALLERRALQGHGITLSMTVWRISKAFLPVIFLMGMMAGGLAVHFWWHWCPPGSVSGG